MTQVSREGLCRKKCVFLFSAGLPGDVLRQSKQCRSKHDVIVGKDRGSLWPRSEGKGCECQNVYFYSVQASQGTVFANLKRPGATTTCFITQSPALNSKPTFWPALPPPELGSSGPPNVLQNRVAHHAVRFPSTQHVHKEPCSE